jgi:predicted acyltransferase
MTTAAAVPSPQPGGRGRIVSLDAFRGATIAAMILVNNPGSNEIYPPLRHAVWHGWTFTDLVFPFFLWITGLAMTLSLGKRAATGADRGRLILHILRRAALIFLVGMLLNGFPFYRLATIRIPGVLQRIAICYLIAAVVFLYTRTRGRVWWIAGLLALYLVLMHPGGYEKESNFAKHVDGLLLTGHMYSATKTWDPEGVVSTLPAIATTLFGILAGELLRRNFASPDLALRMFLYGNALIAAGLLLDPLAPINKNLWTPSYSLFMAGMAQTAFGFFYWLVDVLQWRRAAEPFRIYGMNAIVVYALSGLLARALGLLRIGDISAKSWMFAHFFAPLASPVNASALYGVANVLVLYVVAWVMYRREWFVRL